jgi:hypothetical protein
MQSQSMTIFNAEPSDIDYFFGSRLKDEPEPIEDISLLRGAIPRSARVAAGGEFSGLTTLE